MTQLTFELWDRKAKFALLRTAELSSSKSYRNVYDLVEAIELCADNESLSHARAEVLRGKMRVSRRTFQRALNDAVALGVVEVTRNPSRAGGQGPSEYRIDWQKIRSYSKAPPPPKPTKRRGVSPLGQNGLALGQSGQALGQNDHPMIIDPHLDPLSKSHSMNGSNSSPKAASRNRSESDAARAQRKEAGGWERPITLGDLRKPERVDELFDYALDYFQRPRPLSDDDRLRFHTLAAYCVRRGLEGHLDDPGAVFTSYLKRRVWQGVNADEDHARESIILLDRSYEPSFTE